MFGQIKLRKVAIICIQLVIIDLKVGNECLVLSFSVTIAAVATMMVRLNY